MKRDALISSLLDHFGVDSIDDALEGIVFDRFHNAAICDKCEEIVDIEPDAQPFPCHCEGCDGTSHPLTTLVGFPI